jgi:hexosaminidase
MFPESNWFHIGGDEVNFECWERSSECKLYMAKNSINSQKELYTHVVKRLTDTVLKLGKTPVVWEGFPEDGAQTLSKEVIVMAWESYYQPADRLLENGFKVINCSWQPLYVVSGKGWDPKDLLSWNIYNWQHWWPKSVAHLNPIHVQPTDKVLGGQLCAWEGDFEEEMIRVKQNLATLSERTWTIKRYCEDEQFNKKLDSVLPLLNKLQETRK